MQRLTKTTSYHQTLQLQQFSTVLVPSTPMDPPSVASANTSPVPCPTPQQMTATAILTPSPSCQRLAAPEMTMVRKNRR